MAATLNAATFMGKNFSTIQSVVKNHEDLTLKQMFDVTSKLVNNQDEINGLDKIQWEKLKEKQKWSEEKIHLENARNLRGIYFIDPEDTEFKETIKYARKKLETSVAPAMPCKIAKNGGNGASNQNSDKTCVYSGS